MRYGQGVSEPQQHSLRYRPRSRPTPRPHQAPRFLTAQVRDTRATTLPLAGFGQGRDYTCGFATTLMVMRYFDVRVPAAQLFERLGTTKEGTRQSAIVRELRAAGLRVGVRYDMGFDRIADEIERNKLVVGYLDDKEHWLVIYGYRRDAEGAAEIFVADPGEGACVQPWAEYGPRLGSFGIVVSRPGPARGVRQAPLALPDDPAPILPRSAGRLQCRVYGFPAELPAAPAVPAQLCLPFA
jgi:hypothetical protein